MLKVIIILLSLVSLFSIFSYCHTNKVQVHFKSFFRKGFKKTDDDYGCYCMTAPQGSGKTYSCIDFLDNIKDRKVITNVYSYYERCRDVRDMEYEPDLNQIIRKLNAMKDCSNIVVFFDEAFSALDSHHISKPVRTFFSQFRKKHLYFLTTCQIWSDLPITFRKLTRYAVNCKMFNIPLLNFAICINEVTSGYDTKWDSLAQEFVSPRIRTTIKKCGKAVADQYDTYEQILAL